MTGECLKILADHLRPVYALAFSPDGRWLGTGSGDGWMNVYSVKTKKKKWGWFAGPEKPGVFEIAWQQTGDIDRIALALASSKCDQRITGKGIARRFLEHFTLLYRIENYWMVYATS